MAGAVGDVEVVVVVVGVVVLGVVVRLEVVGDVDVVEVPRALILEDLLRLREDNVSETLEVLAVHLMPQEVLPDLGGEDRYEV